MIYTIWLLGNDDVTMWYIYIYIYDDVTIWLLGNDDKYIRVGHDVTVAR